MNTTPGGLWLHGPCPPCVRKRERWGFTPCAPSEFGGLCDFKVVTRFVRVALGIRMCTSLREDAHKISSDICPWGRARRLGAGDVSPRRAACAFQKRVQSRAHARPNALPHDPRPSPGHHQTATHDEAEVTSYSNFTGNYSNLSLPPRRCRCLITVPEITITPEITL